MQFILINKEGLYLGETSWVTMAAYARKFDADEAAELVLRRKDCFAWRVGEVPPTGSYEPERLQNNPAWRDNFVQVRAA